MPAIPEYFGTPNKLLTELQDLATKDTAKYFYDLPKMPEFISGTEPETIETMDAAKAKLREVIVDEVTIDNGYIAEFGVDKGKSFVQLCDLFPDDEVYGFDAFAGLPEGGKWHGNTIHKGMFNNGGNPPFDIPDNGHILNGWFENTLPDFKIGRTEPAKYLHIDCDVYSSTITILKEIGNSIVPGTIIVFDDYCNYTGWRTGEWKAWQEFVEANDVSYEYIYVAGMAAGVKVTKRAD